MPKIFSSWSRRGCSHGQYLIYNDDVDDDNKDDADDGDQVDDDDADHVDDENDDIDDPLYLSDAAAQYLICRFQLDWVVHLTKQFSKVDFRE